MKPSKTKPHVLSKKCYFAFSLVEMLMALLVASLLLAALAPVMTKRMNENININGNMNPPDANVTKEVIDYMSDKCKEPKIDADGSEYCEGEFIVPPDYNGIMKVTVVGAGGGGGTAPTAGYTEYTTVSNTHQFTVPAMVNKAEVTLVSGGAGGGAGGQIIKTQTFVTSGNGNITADNNNKVTVNSSGTGTWTIPEATRGKNIIASACGGGGGGGSTVGTWVSTSNPASDNGGHGGGSGGYVLNKILNFGSANNFTYYIGGGGAGARGAYYHKGPLSTSNAAKNYGGGGSGSTDLALYAAAIGGGNGTAFWTQGFVSGEIDTKPPAAGKLLTASNIGGIGGQGVPNGSTTTASGINYNLYAHAADGGQPGGGGGGLVHFSGCYSGAGGGGGGASQIVVGSGIYLNAPGGGGGASAVRKNPHDRCIAGFIAGGGGGGGTGGGAGGSSMAGPGRGGTGGANGYSYNGGTINTIFGSNYCNGGRGGIYGGVDDIGLVGNSGAIRLTYQDYGPGASGGGAGQIVPIQSVDVIPNENLTILVGSGASGGTTGNINSTGVITSPANGYGAKIHPSLISKLFRGNTLILTTSPVADGYNGTEGGCPNGEVSGGNLNHTCGNHGRITTGNPNIIETIQTSGFISYRSNSAGNIFAVDKTGFSPKTSGGNGGVTTLFGLENHCIAGKGGTSTSINGTDAAGYGGCGGGGGYAFGNGGKGAGGYARISWNKYWDIASEAYKLAEVGAGGGGASGNILTYTVSVIGGQVIKVRIGKGGKGAHVSNNVIVEAKKGGDTIFGDSAFGEIKAGGGQGGSSPSINSSNNTFVNGAGGNISNICHYKSTNLLNKSSCIKGTKGNNASDKEGGKGANMANYGVGGTGGIQDTGDNANGKNATGYASGGGGAAIRDLGKVDSSSQSNITNNKTIGGDGSNGRIILEWWE